MSFIYIIGIYIDYLNHLNIYQRINKNLSNIISTHILNM